MADWRIRNFVPDSDEEEEGDISTQSGLGPPPDNRPGRAFLDIEHIEPIDRRKGGSDKRSSLSQSQKLPPQEAAATISLEIDDGSEDELALPGPHNPPATKVPSESSPGISSSEGPVQDEAHGRENAEQISPIHQILHELQYQTIKPTTHEDFQLASGPPSPVPSSPLTDLPSTPSLELSQQTIIRGGNESHEDGFDVSLQSAELQKINEKSVSVEESSRLSHGDYQRVRTFRARNPIQLNPYRIEVERYRQAWKSRGLKPVRIDPVNEDSASQSSEKSSDETFTIADDTRPPGNASDPEINDQSLTQAAWSSSPVQDEDVDLPDIDKILQGSNAGAKSFGNKRRKITHVYSVKNGRGAHRRYNNSLEAGQELSPNIQVLVPNRYFDEEGLPTPPVWSSSPVPAQDGSTSHPAFRYPIGRTPTQLPTPALSSEPRTRRPIVFSDTETTQSDEKDDPVPLATQVSPKSSREAMEELIEIRKVKRKIKGVLPASWLRIDQKRQTDKSKDAVKVASTSPDKGTQRGVARPLFKRTKLQNGASDNGSEPSIAIDDSSESEKPIDDRRASMQEQNNAPPIDVRRPLQWDDSDSMEYDDVDQILPKHIRKRGNTKAEPMKSKLMHTSKVLHSSATGISLPKRQSIIVDHISNKRKPHNKLPKARAQRLSVFDVNRTFKAKKQPNFLRVASRTAKLRTDKGRHSPSRKYLRLASREDTADVQDILSTWRENSMALVAKDVPLSPEDFANTSRQPLSYITGNEQALITGDVPSGEAPEPFHTPSLKRPRIRRKQRTIQQALEGMRKSEQKTIMSPVEHLQKHTKQSLRRKAVSSNVKLHKHSIPAILENPSTGVPTLAKRHQVQTDLASLVHMKSDLRNRPNPLLERFIESVDVEPGLTNEGMITNGTTTSTTAFLPRERKRKPKQLTMLQTPVNEFQRSWEEVKASLNRAQEAPIEGSGQVLLHGLQPYGAEYTWTFDIEPLPTGLCFGRQTLLGSGRFEQYQNVSRDLSKPSSEISIPNTRMLNSWGPWNEVVSSDIGKITHDLASFLRVFEGGAAHEYDSQLNGLDSIVQYVSGNLHFLDAIDRRAFLDRCAALLGCLLEATQDFGLADNSRATHVVESECFMIQIMVRLAILAGQLLQLSDHSIVEGQAKASIGNLFRAALTQTIQVVFANGTHGLLSFQEHLQMFFDPATTDKTSGCKAEAFVICLHLLKRNQFPDLNIWQLLPSVTAQYLTYGLSNVGSLELRWLNLFAILPYFDVKADGSVDTTSRHLLISENWSYVEDLLKPPFNAHSGRFGKGNATLNGYCRCAIARCFRLIQTWRWVKCEAILRILYDFFAKNNLENLRNEQSHRSPRFIQDFSTDVVLFAEKDDPSFHLFLKTLCLGLLRMRNVYSNRKIQGIVYRVTPNHSRSLPKDEAVRQEDLDSLRNHHDLLSVLFLASPAGFRPKLGIIRELICVENSHRQACHINIHTWASLIAFQLRSGEPVSALDPFVDWFNHLLHQILQLHNVARVEAETHSCAISEELREKTIASNQRQVEAILSDALECLGKALPIASTAEAAWVLFTPYLKDVVGLFDTRHSRIDFVVIQALDLISSFVSHAEKLLPNDESQGFGDWAAFAELEPGLADTTNLSIPEPVSQSLHTLLSDCFGANTVPDDTLLIKVIQTWLRVAKFEIKAGLKSWSDYVEPYGRESWFALRRTAQTSKHTPLFLSLLVESDGSTYEEDKNLFLKAWLISIVERESQLKFQHALTNSLLNQDRDNPLLENLPFSMNPSDNRFDITLQEFRDRRLSLLSCLFSNLQESLNFANYHDLPEKRERRQEYAELISTVMKAMRENYESLRDKDEGHSAYVGFVHSVVGFLQQYTSDICPVDRFFVEGRNFPLPSADPTFVISKIKSYQPKLHETRTRKGFATFVQALTERATIAGEQEMLVHQLQSAMSQDVGQGETSNLSLRDVFVQTIFPAYTTTAISTSCGWLFAEPILQVVDKLFEEMLPKKDGAKDQSVLVLANMQGLFISIQRSLTLVVNHTGCLELPHVLRVLTEYYATLNSSLKALDHCIATTCPCGRDSLWSDRLNYFRALAKFTLQHLSGQRDMGIPVEDDFEWDFPKDEAGLAPIRDYAIAELKSALQHKWYKTEEGYFARNGGVAKQLPRGAVKIGSFEEERNRFVERIKVFWISVNGFASLKDLKWQSDMEMTKLLMTL